MTWTRLWKRLSEADAQLGQSSLLVMVGQCQSLLCDLLLDECKSPL